MLTTRPLKVFLCHASADKPAVRKLYAYLKKQKIDAWLDAEKLLGGQNWRTEIPKAIKGSDAIIVCLSKNSVNKEGYIQKEIKFALDKADEMPSGRIFLIPAKLEECEVPIEFADYHWVNLFEEDGYRRLMRSLRVRADQIETVTDISDVPHEEDTNPMESKKDSSDDSIGIGGDVSGANIIMGNHNVIHVAPSVGQASSLTDAPVKKENPVIKPEPKKQSSAKFPIWGIGLIIFAFLALVVYGISSTLSSPQPTETSPVPNVTVTSQVTVTLPVPTETPVPATPTVLPTPILGIGSTEVSDKDGMTLLYVPAGKFTMGDKAEDALTECKKYDSGCQLSWFADEQPPHEVDLSAFWIDQTEVTNAMYVKCVEAGKCDPPSNTDHFSNSSYANHPVVYVDWNKASAYCSWAGRQLPSEAQWEKAARGTDGRTYPWGNDAPNKDLLNYNSNIGDTTKVRNYETGKSFYGAYDMAGNVWEWVNDWYSETYYQSPPPSNPLGPNTGQYRVLRGGSWVLNVYFVRSANRNGYDPANASVNFGFRCSRSRP